MACTSRGAQTRPGGGQGLQRRPCTEPREQRVLNELREMDSIRGSRSEILYEFVHFCVYGRAFF